MVKFLQVVWLKPVLIMFAIHFLVFVLVALNFQIAFLEILHRWDSGWYLRIIQLGYDAQSYAFFPLYPLTVQWFGFLFGILHPAYVGSLLSVLFFLLFFYFGFFEVGYDRQNDSLSLVKRNRKYYATAVWLFLLSPASYVFHTVHTESLFLLTTGGALYFYRRDKILLAAVFCGLSSLTRIQGCLLSMALAFHVLLFSQGAGRSRNLLKFVWISSISFGFFSLYLLYQYLEVGDAFQFLKAHNEWAHGGASSPFVWIKSFFLMNPWQTISLNSLMHHGFYFLLLFLSVQLFKRGAAEGLYGILSLAIIPFQGEFVDIFRFGAVLFPLFFLLAEYIESLAKVFFYKFFFTAWIAVNLAVTYAYCIGKWAY